MKDGWWWYWTSGVFMGLVFAITLVGHRFDLIIPLEAYVLLILMSLFSVALFVMGCKVEK